MKKKTRNRLIVACVCVVILLIGIGLIKGVKSMIGNHTQSEVITSQDTKKDKSTKKKDEKDSSLNDRIKAYMKENPDLSKKEATKRVKMNLDKEPYTNTTTVTDLDSITMLVNKYNGLPEDYEPEDLVTVTNSGEHDAKMRKEAAEAFEKLIDAANQEGIELCACSAYRSYSYQKNLFENGKENYGLEYADAYWTRPGFSEHQTGLSVDIRLDGDISDLDAPRNSENYPWLLKHMHEYGFIVRYPDDKEQYTLISPESWHLRYVGKDLATYLYENNLCLDEYYGLQE